MSRDRLLALHCRQLGASAAQDAGMLSMNPADLPQWRRDGKAILDTCRFAGLRGTMLTINAPVVMVHREDHHPDLEVGYNRCTVRFSALSADGITENDPICVARADANFDQWYGTS